jgi:MFS transporter, DHA1 family, tetracycline resistance protein
MVLAGVGLRAMILQGRLVRPITARVSGSKRRQLQGAIARINGMTDLIGPTLFSQIFAYFISARWFLHVPDAPLLLALMLMIRAPVFA